MEEIKSQLPENAFRELKEGEKYEPLMSPGGNYPEVTTWSVTWGVLMAIVFSAAAAYLGLKVGQVFEAAIPIAIIAVGLSTATKRSRALGENVIIQSIGACSGAVVAGAIFTLPAIYILQAKYPEMSASFLKVFMASALGGCLGILFLIPFRKYFVSDMHGKYPFPEATATTQVLVTGIREAPLSSPEGDTIDPSTKTKEAPSGAVGGASGAGILVIAGLIGGLYDFIVSTFGWWNEVVTTRMIGWGEVVADKAKLVFKVNTSAAVLGLGYIIGLKYALFICLGSLFIWWLVVPGIGLLFHDQVLTIGSATASMTVGEMSPEQIFTTYARSIGIGGIAMAGIIGIVKSWGVIKGAVSLMKPTAKEPTPNPSPREGGLNSSADNTNQSPLPSGGVGGGPDLPIKFIAIASLVALAVTFVFFWLGVMHNLWFAVVSILLVTVIAFLFTTVAANAIAIVGSNPVSGMTLMTLILASVVLAGVGLSGTEGMVAALIMGGVVCTALSMAGAFITDLKIGYWLGSTPRKQESWKFLGTLVSAATVGGVIMLLNETYGFASGELAAPQANAMAAVIDPLMNGQGAPWLLYAIGAVLALILTFLKIPALPVALGMFIPLQLNMPLLVGGAVNWYVTTRSKDKAVNDARGERGTLIASGFIAGGALMGVVSALMRFGNLNFVSEAWMQNPLSELCALVAYVLLIAYFIRSSVKR
ncbi:MAG: oligopeptide transporter, OPT family [Prevotella sp.]|nr:oligopeptide transporter, OPT family [Prevotella sp.]